MCQKQIRADAIQKRQYRNIVSYGSLGAQAILKLKVWTYILRGNVMQLYDVEGPRCEHD